jgi:hypothetical protein
VKIIKRLLCGFKGSAADRSSAGKANDMRKGYPKYRQMKFSRTTFATRMAKLIENFETFTDY